MKPRPDAPQKPDFLNAATRFWEVTDYRYNFFLFFRPSIDPRWILPFYGVTILNQGLVNKRSTTWKGLSAEERQEAETGDTTAVLLANPTLIKRPILEHADILDVGFSEQAYAAHFQL